MERQQTINGRETLPTGETGTKLMLSGVGGMLTNLWIVSGFSVSSPGSFFWSLPFCGLRTPSLTHCLKGAVDRLIHFQMLPPFLRDWCLL